MAEIRAWLASHGLSKYGDVFVANDIGLDVVARLSEDELKELGVSLGDRKRLAAAVEQLSEPLASPPDPTPEVPGHEAERRHLTVMFCDLVGSTALSAQMDPEDFRAVIARYQEAATGAIALYDGYVARYMGDGLLVYFGYPQAHEDDAERAVRAGLAVIEAVTAAGANGPARLAVRVGIASGLVVAGDLVGEGASEERAVLGDTPNLAARLQGIAEPNRVVVSANTHRLTEGLFEVEVLRGLALKGLPARVEAYRIDRESGASSRFEALAARGLTPLVGRESELGLLLSRWEQARDGEGQLVLLSGEAGVGKSRIARAFVDRIGPAPHLRLTLSGSPYHAASAYYPIIELLRRGFALAPDEEARAATEKLASGVSGLGLPVAELVPVLAALLSVPATAGYPIQDLSPPALREKTLDALRRLIAAQAAAQPLVLLVEDAHWLDASSLEFLGLIVEDTETAPILMIVTHRPEFEPPWLGHAHATAHTLNRLGRSETEKLVRAIIREGELPPELVDEIVAKTDGVPLFIEELTKALLESALSPEADPNLLPGAIPTGAVPDSLQDSLMARLDQLASVKQVAQFAAVLGRTFSQDRLLAASPFEDAVVEAALGQLSQSGLIYRRGTGPHPRYEFKHALVRDAAYESLLKNRRQEYHARIARTLEERFRDVAETEPEQLGHHYTEAGLKEQAIPYWRRAGSRALERSALVEAIAALDNAVDLCRSLPPSRQQRAMELELQLSLATAQSQRGLASEGTAAAYVRAKALADESGDHEQRFRASFGLWFVHQHRGELDAARRMSDELLAVAGSQEDPGLELEACHAGWTTRFVGEELNSVIDLTERGIALYDVNRHQDHRHRFGHDAGACALTVNAMTRMFLGFADQARDRANQALTLADRLDHPTSKAQTLGFGTNVFRLRREPAIVESWIDAQLDLCERYGFRGQLPFGHIIRGWALAAQGQGAGIDLIVKGLETIRSFGIKTLSFQLCSLADAYWWVGRPEAGLRAVDEAIAVIETVGERRWEPEIYRLQAEMLLAVDGDEDAAQSALTRALGIARAQGARWFELRSATSLARLRHRQGMAEEAHALLAPVVAWFSEGRDTADLAEANTLLRELT